MATKIKGDEEPLFFTNKIMEDLHINHHQSKDRSISTNSHEVCDDEDIFSISPNSSPGNQFFLLFLVNKRLEIRVILR